MVSVVYLLCTLTTLGCALLLLRAYSRVKRKLLLWSGLCFAGLTVSNFLVFVDLVMLTRTDLLELRLATAAAAMIPLLYGLIWESE